MEHRIEPIPLKNFILTTWPKSIPSFSGDIWLPHVSGKLKHIQWSPRPSTQASVWETK